MRDHLVRFYQNLGLKCPGLLTNFKSYFGLHTSYRRLYSELVNLTWEYYFADLVNADLDEIYSSKKVKINNTIVGLEGLEFTDTNEIFDWKDLEHKEYFKYFAIHKSDNSKIYKTFNFNEWNAERLYCLIRTIKKERGA